jgi:hypothetical protein
LSQEKELQGECLRKFRSRTIAKNDRWYCDYWQLQSNATTASKNLRASRQTLLTALYSFQTKDKIAFSKRSDDELLQSAYIVLGQVRHELTRAKTNDQRAVLEKQFKEAEIATIAFGNALANDPSEPMQQAETEISKGLEQLQIGIDTVQVQMTTGEYGDKKFLRLIEDASIYQQLLAGWPYKFITLPSITLTLIITVFMGILGSAISLIREFVFEGTEYTLSQYLFRVGLSGAVALAVFFAAAAGVLVLAKSGTGDGKATVEISPYLLAFLAIVAGYLSLRVTNWLGEIGTNMFQLRHGGTEVRDRYGIGLAKAMQDAELGDAGLATLVGVSIDEMRAIIDGTRPANFDKQRLLSAALRRPLGELFTDIAPA